MDEQVEVLRAIWNEMKALNGRIDGTNHRLDAMNENLGGRIDAMNESLGGRIDASNDRIDAPNGALLGLRADLEAETRRRVDHDLQLGTSIAELSLDVRELTGIVHSWRDEHRLDREELRERIVRLERRAGPEPR